MVVLCDDRNYHSKEHSSFDMIKECFGLICLFLPLAAASDDDD